MSDILMDVEEEDKDGPEEQPESVLDLVASGLYSRNHVYRYSDTERDGDQYRAVEPHEVAEMDFGSLDHIDNGFLKPDMLLVPEMMTSGDYVGCVSYFGNREEFLERHGSVDGVHEVSGGYGTTGVAIELRVTNEALIGDLKGLVDYPILDDARDWDVQQDEIESEWVNWAYNDFAEALTKKFGDEIYDFHPTYSPSPEESQKLREVFDIAAERANCDWEQEGMGRSMYIRLSEVVEAVEEGDIQGFYQPDLGKANPSRFEVPMSDLGGLD